MSTSTLDPAALRELTQRIIASGVLGRSRHYRNLLEYLVECSLADKTPKEIDLAIDGLKRGDDYDVSADSTVRVYVHQLRKKLDNYYQQHEPGAEFRLVIPKGQYRLELEASQAADGGNSQLASALARRLSGGSSKDPSHGWRWTLNSTLLASVAVLLVVNAMLLLSDESPVTAPPAQASEHAVWQTILSDDRPILLVMGDYYIFGELNANGNIARMVREFNVNSRSDLEELQFSDIATAENYLDLDLSYMPEGSAFALARIVPLLQRSGKPVNITMMSDLTTAEIRSNHVVYIGYISALDKLTGMAFAASGLTIGRSYDELLNLDTEQYYTSDAGLPEEGEPFRDYGFFATFPVSSETQVVLVAGMRDAGLMHTAQALSDTESLHELVASIDHDTDEAVASFEALYEVYGVDRLNFDAELLYSKQLDAEKIWRIAPETGLN
ncbi:MAG: hypothetical protein RKH07_02690 [Gammaproteobacteria bacterium]